MSAAALVEKVGGLEHFFDEHGSLTFGRWREKVQILPDGAPDGARDADVMFKAGPTASDGFQDQVAHDDATLAPHPALFVKTNVSSSVPNNEAAKAPVANQDVGAEAEDELRDAGFTRGDDRVCQIIGRGGIVEEVGRTPDTEGGVWR